MKHLLAYIDENDGWINTFYQTFKADFDILKVKIDSASSIKSIIEKLFENKLDAIVTDYLLEEEGNVTFNGNRIIEELKKNRPHFPIIMLTAYESQAISNMDDVHIIYSKDILDDGNEKQLEVFKSKIKSNISNYNNKINETNKRVEVLVKKRNKKGLEPKEEEELDKLFIILDELNPEGKDLPSYLINRESISKLNEFVAETKEILKELKKQNKK